MPLYQVICPYHGKQEVFFKRRVSVQMTPCPVCGEICSRDWSAESGLRPFRSYWTESLSQDMDRPVYIDSREKEKKLCKKFGFERVS